MAITVDQFYDLLIDEIKQFPKLQGYYRFLQNPSTEHWRKAYFTQRLEYIHQQAKGYHHIWDVGCGYGTTAIFLVLNGHKVHGSTLEYYFNEIPSRLDYWKRFGDLSGFSVDYENLYDANFHQEFDAVVVQDTIHHTEPIHDALNILHQSLKAKGQVIAVEENGKNIIQRLKLYKQRGNKRIIEFHDEKLGKTILLGNENIRSYQHWKQLFAEAGFVVDEAKTNYVRLFPPQLFSKDAAASIAKEQAIWKKNAFLRDYFFFGLSFCAVKP